MNRDRILTFILFGALALIVLFDIHSAAFAQFVTTNDPLTQIPAATQNTVTTTGPVSSETTISIGTLAGQVLTWVMAVFGVPIGTLATAILWKVLKRIGVSLTDASRARLQEIIVNG